MALLTGAPASDARAQIGTANSGEETQGVRIATRFPGGDIGAQVNRAFAECGRACEVTIPAGVYENWTTPIEMTRPEQSLTGAGSALTILNFTGSGDGIVWQADPFVPTQAGRISGITIHGTARGRSGVHSGTIIGASFEDLHIDGFTGAGAACMWLDNVRGGWTERTTMRKVEIGASSAASSCSTDLLMTVHGGTSSFGYNRWTDLNFNVNAGQTGIMSSGGTKAAEFYHSQLAFTCNDSAATGTCVSLTGNSNWHNNTYQLAGESAAAGSAANCMETASTHAARTNAGTAISVAAGSRLTGYGTIDFPDMCLTNANGGTFAGTFRIVGGTAAGAQDGGVMENFLGSGVAATVHPMVIDGKDSPEGFGLFHGANVASPYALMYGAGNTNAFVVGTLGFDQPPSAMKQVARIDTEGNVHVAGAYFANGQDYAEMVSVAGAREEYEAGDVMAIDAEQDGRFVKAAQAYSTSVAGVVSAKPGVVGSRNAMRTVEDAGEVPLAIAGIVPCKVTAQGGAIARGDVLVSSPRAGYAMKGADRARLAGAIVGKALEPLRAGEGVIEILVTLQ